jgi:hypothetical protein
MAYTPETPNAFDHSLIPLDISAKYHWEYLGTSLLTPFMGEKEIDIIQTKELSNGSGGTATFTVRLDSPRRVIRGYEQLSGNEQKPIFYGCKVDTELVRFAEKLENTPYVELLTPIKVFESIRPALMRQQQELLLDDVLDKACATIANGGMYDPDVATGPSVDRAVFAAAGGGSAASWNATINTAIAAMGAATYAASGLSVAHIRTLHQYAVNGGSGYVDLNANSPGNHNETRIQPTKVYSYRGAQAEEYVLLITYDAYRSLVLDPEWKDFAYRGIIQTPDQPQTITGARFKGMVEGVLVYVWPELSNYKVSTGGRVASWNLLLGGQAFGVVWGRKPWFVEDLANTDFGINRALASSEIRGQKVITYPGKVSQDKLIERGIIHSFTRVS